MTNLEFIKGKISNKINIINNKRAFLERCKQNNVSVDSNLTLKDEKELEKLRKIEKILEKWELAKNKTVDFNGIKNSKNVEEYNSCLQGVYQLTKEEFEAFKEILLSDENE